MADDLTLPTFDTLDSVPEPFRPLYAEDNGKVVPRVKVGASPEDVAALQGALAKERETRQAAERKAAELERQRRAERAKADSGLDDETLKRIRADVEAELAPKLQAGEQAAARLARLEMERALRAAAAEAGVDVANAKKFDRFVRVLADEVTFTDQGTLVPKAHPTRSLVDWLKTDVADELPEFYKGSGANGGAGGDPTGGAAFDLEADVLTWPEAQREAYRTRHGLAAYEALVAKSIAKRRAARERERTGTATR